MMHEMGEESVEGMKAETSPFDDARKMMIKMNFYGLVQAGINAKDALEMALDFNEPVFSRRLQIKRPGEAQAGPGRGSPGGLYGSGEGEGMTKG